MGRRRNEACLCKSGKKFKNCCLKKIETDLQSAVAMRREKIFAQILKKPDRLDPLPGDPLLLVPTGIPITTFPSKP